MKGQEKMKMRKHTKAAPSPMDKLKRSAAYKLATPTEKLDLLLTLKTFDQLLADGDILDVKGAADKSGYSPKHVHRLCREDRIDHLRRGLVPEEVQFYFLDEQLKGLFSYHKARA